MSKCTPKTTDADPYRLWSVSSAAEKLGVSRATVYRYVKDGALRTVIPNGYRERQYISDIELRRFVREGMPND